MSNELRNFLLRIPFWAAGIGLMAWAVGLSSLLPVALAVLGAYVFCIKVEIWKS